MTYQNDPNRRTAPDDRAGISGEFMAVVAVIAILLAGGIIYGLSREDTPIANNNAPPMSAPSTTGQGGSANVTPGEQQNAPNPGTPPR
jgi:hypothetical protein